MVSDNNNRRIALNTVVLYAKLFLSSIIGLFTSRFILQALGASDYGLYQVVGGFVIMMNFLGATMSSVTTRYIIVEYGKGEKGDCCRVFNTLLVIHLILALFLILLGESFGTYYIMNIANFEYDKIDDAIFILHFSIMSSVFSVLSIPYSGLIMAREKFIFTASVEIIRTLVQFFLVLSLLYYSGNRLRIFAVISLLYNVISPTCMYLYCQIKMHDTIKWLFNAHWNEYVEIFKYAFWMMIGAISFMCQSQGANMIINFFYGTVLNAAYGIANQVNTYVMMFVRGLNQAALPQIMKSQGNDGNRSSSLVYITTRYSYLILLVMFFPLILNIDYILKLWLKDVPAYTSMFVCILLVTSLVRCLGSGFDAMIQASGMVKTNQIVYSVAYIAILPLSFILYKYNFHLLSINILILLTAMFFIVFQVFYLSKITALTMKGYFYSTIVPCFRVTLSCIPLFFIKKYFPGTFTGFVISLMFSLVWCIGFMYVWGMHMKEKTLILNQIRKIVKSK